MMTSETGRAARRPESSQMPPVSGGISTGEPEVIPENKSPDRIPDPEKKVSSLLKFYTRRALSKINSRKILKQKLHRSRKTRRDP
jgi:hypothetical protein